MSSFNLAIVSAISSSFLTFIASTASKRSIAACAFAPSTAFAISAGRSTFDRRFALDMTAEAVATAAIAPLTAAPSFASAIARGAASPGDDGAIRDAIDSIMST